MDVLRITDKIIAIRPMNHGCIKDTHGGKAS